MPERSLPFNANLGHLKHQARDLLNGHAERDPAVAQRIREFHPRFAEVSDRKIFGAKLSLTAAQLVLAREHGFASSPMLKSHIDRFLSQDQLNLPHHERIEDSAFRTAVDLMDAGDAAGLRAQLQQHPDLLPQHVVFEGGNYFRNPTLLDFVAENPIRHGTLPHNIVAVAKVILDAGVERSALNETLTLVLTGSVARQCAVQVALSICSAMGERSQAAL